MVLVDFPDEVLVDTLVWGMNANADLGEAASLISSKLAVARNANVMRWKNPFRVVVVMFELRFFGWDEEASRIVYRLLKFIVHVVFHVQQ